MTGSAALLDWLEVPRRHRLDGAELDGLVLLDLPDFDSVERGHRLEVDRLVELVDLVVWVVDPQKYADAAWHDGYLRPLSRHGEAMAVVLNQADLLDGAALAACLADLAACSSATGCQACRCSRSRPRRARDCPSCGGCSPSGWRRARRSRRGSRPTWTRRQPASRPPAAAPRRRSTATRARGLLDALEDAAGVPTVVRAVERAHRRSGTLATGWPFARWIKRLRPDPLRRLRLGDEANESVHTSLPPASAVQVARVENAARALAGAAAADLPEPWPALVRAAAGSKEQEVAAELDRAVAGADLHGAAPALVAARRPAPDRSGGRGRRRSALAARAARARLPAPGRRAADAGGEGGAAADRAAARRRSGRDRARLPDQARERRGRPPPCRAAARSLRKRLEVSAQTLVLAPLEEEIDAFARFCAAVASAQASRPSTAPKRA